MAQLGWLQNPQRKFYFHVLREPSSLFCNLFTWRSLISFYWLFRGPLTTRKNPKPVETYQNIVHISYIRFCSFSAEKKYRTLGFDCLSKSEKYRTFGSAQFKFSQKYRTFGFALFQFGGKTIYSLWSRSMLLRLSKTETVLFVSVWKKKQLARKRVMKPSECFSKPFEW